jgi:hypothetical protein
MRGVFERLKKAAPTDLTVLVTGETGTGKELVAQAIHEASARANKPFVVVDCGAIPATLAESALFGHERGSFTGAVDKRISPFVEADGGTIFLDELGELPSTCSRSCCAPSPSSASRASGRTRTARQRPGHRRHAPRPRARGQRRHFRSDLYFRVAQLKVELPSLRAAPRGHPGPRPPHDARTSATRKPTAASPTTRSSG